MTAQPTASHPIVQFETRHIRPIPDDEHSLLAVFPTLNNAAVIVVFAAVGIGMTVVGYDLLQKS